MEEKYQQYTPCDPPHRIGFQFSINPCIALSPTGDLAEAAHHLFAYLRELDALPVQNLYAEMVPDTGLGRAINDRLRRAAAR